MENTNLMVKLEQEMAINMSELRGEVAEILINNLYGTENSEIVATFNDLSNHGCISGMITGMIYYYETTAFFDKWEEEIQDLFLNIGMENEYDMAVDCKYDEDEDNVMLEKNNLAWTAFELVAFDIMQELEI